MQSDLNKVISLIVRSVVTALREDKSETDTPVQQPLEDQVNCLKKRVSYLEARLEVITNRSHPGYYDWPKTLDKCPTSYKSYY